jgi:hypothetical protein
MECTSYGVAAMLRVLEVLGLDRPRNLLVFSVTSDRRMPGSNRGSFRILSDSLPSDHIAEICMDERYRQPPNMQPTEGSCIGEVTMKLGGGAESNSSCFSYRIKQEMRRCTVV